MNYITVDLGSTNIKVGLFNEKLRCLEYKSSAVKYIRNHAFVEFDADLYAQTVMDLIRDLKATEISQIIFTGQAESLVMLDNACKPLCNAISWMDERSTAQCIEISNYFTVRTCHATTGQQAILPTWPASKILWLRENRPEIFNKVETYVLLKDYLIFLFTGKMVADKSIATFSLYFDIFRGCYWNDMLDFIGISLKQLPPLTEPCTVVGTLTAKAASLMRLSESVKVNIGTLDHFSGMIGVGNVSKGIVSYSTGTVMALATIADKKINKNCSVALHYGFIPDSLVMLPVAESGGICLQWYRDHFMKGVPFLDIDEELKNRTLPNDLIFLPYLVGSNAPEFDKDMCGLFYGMRTETDEYDLAYAVMEGVAHLLKKNCDAIERAGTKIRYIIATGGGAKSPAWCQLQASLTGVEVRVPYEKEASCFGSAIIGAVSDGIFKSYQTAATAVKFSHIYKPVLNEKLNTKHLIFNTLYENCRQLRRII